jgi:NAD(P)-dependent dehydrogenase (short-subunit alcohol dehydrogenase family)
MDFELQGKRALVTGASSGLGAAMAKMLAGEGVTVVVNGRNPERTAQTVSEIEAKGGKAVIALGDLTRDEEANRVADIAERELGGIDILVNNAGGSLRNDNPPWTDISIDDYRASFDFNLLCAIRLTQRLAPAMCERGWGRIINISSTAGRQALGALHDYGPAKAALENWGLNLSKNLSPHGVTVNTIEPGMCVSAQAIEFLLTLRDQNGWPDDMDEIQRRYCDEVFPQTIKRLGKPEEVALAVTLLASPHSDYTTGATWRIDGGTSIAAYNVC